VARKRRVEVRLGEPPPFDKEDFLRKEISDAKLTFVTFLIALGFTTGSIGIYHAGSAGLAILLGFIGIPALPFLHRVLGFDLDRLFPLKEGKREEEEVKAEKRGRSMRMLGQWFTFFFTWLSIFVIALNPPFADVSGPALNDVLAREGKDTFPRDPASPSVIRVNRSGSFSIVVTLTDPSGIVDSSVRFNDLGNTKSVTMIPGAGIATHREYSTLVSLSGSGDSIRFTISSADTQGRSSTSTSFVITVK
jgi:hypothetical protein